MARIKEKTWADYDVGPVNELTKAELVKAVRRAAKAANQRLLRLAVSYTHLTLPTIA